MQEAEAQAEAEAEAHHRHLHHVERKTETPLNVSGFLKLNFRVNRKPVISHQKFSQCHVLMYWWQDDEDQWSSCNIIVHLSTLSLSLSKYVCVVYLSSYFGRTRMFHWIDLLVKYIDIHMYNCINNLYYFNIKNKNMILIFNILVMIMIMIFVSWIVTVNWVLRIHLWYLPLPGDGSFSFLDGK